MYGGDEEEEDMESFEIDDRDIEFALNPGMRRGLSKDQQRYGIWADREESDEEGGVPFSGFDYSAGKKKAKNYSAPISFVSGGVKHGNRIEGESTSTSKEEEQPIQIDRRPKRAPRKPVGSNAFAGLRAPTINSGYDPDKFGDWTKCSKSDVILKMMKNMGYEYGKGLGANQQGIVEPVQAVVRRGRGTVGAYGKEIKGPKFGESPAETQKRLEGGNFGDEKEEVEPARQGNWKKSDAKTKRVVHYKTIDEVISEGGPLRKRYDNTSSGVKVIDMTGKEQKVYSGYDAYAAKARAVATTEQNRYAFDVPELTYNINALLDMTEETIRRNDRELRFLKDQTTALENDRKQLTETLEKERDEQRRMKEVLALLEGFAVNCDAEPNLEKCRELFKEMQENYREEYRLFNLEEVAISNVLPLISKHFSNWDPLQKEEHNFGYSLLEEWKKILEVQDCGVFGATTSLENLKPFERILWEGWMPSIRRAALRWNPRDDPTSLLRIVNTWLPILPDWMRENLLEQIIIPRISAQVDEWNPLVDRIPIHIWLLPWVEVMGDRLQPVFSPVRQKLAKALKEWNPSDYSAISVLRPWKNCFAPGTMAAFLATNIMPKLEKALNEMVYDPTRNSRYEEFYATIAWTELLGVDSVAEILRRSFFPKWYDTLCVWLDAPQVVFEEVGMWYNEWKGRLPEELASCHVVREQMGRALMAMQQAHQGLRVSRPAPPPPPPPEPSGFLNPPPPPRGPPPFHSNLSFKDLVEMRAREAGLAYMPQPNKFREGKPVYWFGNASIYLDRNVIFCFNTITQQWAPISLECLLTVC